MPNIHSPRHVRLNEWYLKGFPFPVVPYADPFSTNPLLNGIVFEPSLRQEEIETVQSKVLGSGWNEGIKPWKWLWAKPHLGKNLGTGKTAFLGHIMNEINQDFGETFLRKGANWLAVYARVEPGTHSIGKMAAQVLAGFCNNARGISADYLLLAKLRQQIIMLQRVQHQINRPGGVATKRYLDDQWLLQQGIQKQQLDQEVESLLVSRQVTPDIAQAVAQGKLQVFLTTLNQNQNIRIPGTRLAGRATTILLDDIARIVKVAEINHLTIFLDDFYFFVKNLGETKKKELAEEIRKVAVDGPYYAVTEGHLFNWVAVMHTATAPNFAAAWNNAGLQNIASLIYNKITSEGDRLLLRELELEDGQQILTTYLRYMQRRGAPSAYYPFTPEAIDTIIRIIGQPENNGGALRYIPRDLLKEANRVFTEALDRTDFVPPISVNFVEHIMQNKPLLVQTAEDEDIFPEQEDEPLTQFCPCDCHSNEEIKDIIPVFGGTTQQDAKQLIRYYCQLCTNDVKLAN